MSHSVSVLFLVFTSYIIPFSSLKSLPPFSLHIQKVEEYMIKNLNSVSCSFGSVEDFVVSNGKRIRSIMFLLLFSRFSGNFSEKSYKTACILEMIHTASVFHDDVVDKNYIRRGKSSFYKTFGSKYSILVGDQILINSVSEFLSLHEKNNTAKKIFLKECTSTSFGAVCEQTEKDKKNVSIASYLRIASLKTSPLFKLSCFLGTFLSSKNFDISKKSAIFGICFGIIFQIQNDLDSYKLENFQSSEDYVQKNITFPIVVLCNYFEYNINKFISETNQIEFDYIKSKINSEEFKKTSEKILQKYIKTVENYTNQIGI